MQRLGELEQFSMNCAAIQRNVQPMITYNVPLCQRFCYAFYRNAVSSVIALQMLVNSSFIDFQINGFQMFQINTFSHSRHLIATPNSQFEYEIGGILIGLLQVLQFNAHEIYETKAFESQAAVGGKRLLYVGAALYHSAAYFNHSCCPDVVRYFVGTTIVLSAARPIRADEMIAENYGPNFSKQALHVRQKNLQSRYWFKCSCVCCREDWPILERLSNKARLR